MYIQDNEMDGIIDWAQDAGSAIGRFFGFGKKPPEIEKKTIPGIAGPVSVAVKKAPGWRMDPRATVKKGYKPPIPEMKPLPPSTPPLDKTPGSSPNQTRPANKPWWQTFFPATVSVVNSLFGASQPQAPKTGTSTYGSGQPGRGGPVSPPLPALQHPSAPSGQPPINYQTVQNQSAGKPVMVIQQEAKPQWVLPVAVGAGILLLASTLRR